MRPPALRHVIFANPKENEIMDRNDVVGVETETEDNTKNTNTVSGWLDNLSSKVLEFIPNPWSKSPLVSE